MEGLLNKSFFKNIFLHNTSEKLTLASVGTAQSSGTPVYTGCGSVSGRPAGLRSCFYFGRTDGQSSAMQRVRDRREDILLRRIFFFKKRFHNKRSKWSLKLLKLMCLCFHLHTVNTKW